MAHAAPAARGRPHPVTLILLVLASIATLVLALLDWRGGAPGAPFTRRSSPEQAVSPQVTGERH